MGSTQASSMRGESGPARAPKRKAAAPAAAMFTTATVVLDRFRAFAFPNRIREQRRQRGFPKLMALSERLPEIPYIRLSKIERGEVVARATELQQIARALGVAPLDLLIDVTQPGFDIAVWAKPFQDGHPFVEEEERFAVILAAALRALRNADAALTIAALERDYGIPPVILSRLENAYKTFDRWNARTVSAVCKLFGASDEAVMRALVMDQYRRGDLDDHVGRIADPESRLARTREVNVALHAALAPSFGQVHPIAERPIKAKSPIPAPAIAAEPIVAPRALYISGTALPGGLIAPTPTHAFVPAPIGAGPRAFALRVCRATLGAGLPANAIVVVDPDRAPIAGSLAVIRTGEAYRLVTVTFDRSGATKGYSLMPELEFDIDELDSADVHAVIAAIFP